MRCPACTRRRAISPSTGAMTRVLRQYAVGRAQARRCSHHLGMLLQRLGAGPHPGLFQRQAGGVQGHPGFRLPGSGRVQFFLGDHVPWGTGACRRWYSSSARSWVTAFRRCSACRRSTSALQGQVRPAPPGPVRACAGPGPAVHRRPPGAGSPGRPGHTLVLFPADPHHGAADLGADLYQVAGEIGVVGGLVPLGQQEIPGRAAGADQQRDKEDEYRR